MVRHQIKLPSGCLEKWVQQLPSGDTSDSTLAMELTMDADELGEERSCEITHSRSSSSAQKGGVTNQDYLAT